MKDAYTAAGTILTTDATLLALMTTTAKPEIHCYADEAEDDAPFPRTVHAFNLHEDGAGTRIMAGDFMVDCWDYGDNADRCWAMAKQVMRLFRGAHFDDTEDMAAFRTSWRAGPLRKPTDNDKVFCLSLLFDARGFDQSDADIAL